MAITELSIFGVPGQDHAFSDKTTSIEGSTELSIVGGTTDARDSSATAEETNNMYIDIATAGGVSKAVAYPFPGLVDLAMAGGGPCRGKGVVFNDKLYFVSGSKLIEFNSNFVTSEVGTLSTATGQLQMVAGFSYLMIIDGTYGYYYDGVTFNQITDPDFPVPSSVTWINQYFIVTEKDSGYFYISGLNNPSSWTSSDKALAESKPDKAIAAVNFRGRLMIIGEYTVELYADTGNVDFPFEIYPNTTLELGVLSPWSIATGYDMLVALVKSEFGGHRIVSTTGDSIRRLSTPEIEWQLSQLSSLTDASGFFMEMFGHRFYQISFPTGGKVYTYDLDMGLWYKRTTKDARHRGHGYAYFNGRHIVGDYATNNFYYYSASTYTDAGDWVERSRKFQFVSPNNNLVFIRKLEIVFKQGVGLVNGNGSNPIAYLRYSTDGGHTWNSWREALMGKTGNYECVSIWPRIGWGRQFVFQVRVTQPIEVIILGAYADIETGRH